MKNLINILKEVAGVNNYLKIKDVYCLVMGTIAPKKLADRIFYESFGRNIDWDNPKDLNEKINWLKFYSDTTSWTLLADKYLVREYVKEKGLDEILVPLYGVWDNVETIDFNSLPNQFVLKTNHGSGSVIVCKNKSTLDVAKTKENLKKWMKKKYGIKESEPHYARIIPKVMAEKFLEEDINSFSSSVIDYKIWCINGEPLYIWACYSRKMKSAQVELYDVDWKYHPEWSVFTEHYQNGGGKIPRPKNLEFMVDVARKLSTGFPEVRCDLYNVNNRVYFGEMTFTSNGGYMPYFTEEFLFKLGNLVKLPNNEK